MKLVKNKNGYTLVELLIVMAVVLLIAAIVASNFEAIGITNKARDARRKNDLKKIKITLEEYYNDHGNYPSGALLDSLNNKTNCGKSIAGINLSPWPCDPRGVPYIVATDNSLNQFRVLVNLENKTDKEIPVGWYEHDWSYQILKLYSKDQINFGVSSTNILWYDVAWDYEFCDKSQCCMREASGCNYKTSCSGSDCYYKSTLDYQNCLDRCKVSSCVSSH